MKGFRIIKRSAKDTSVKRKAAKEAATIGKERSMAAKGKCEWKRYWPDWGDMYDTSCGHMHDFLDGNPEDNHYKFCPYCGLDIQEIRDDQNDQ